MKEPVGNFPPNDFLLSIYLKGNGRSAHNVARFLFHSIYLALWQPPAFPKSNLNSLQKLSS